MNVMDVMIALLTGGIGGSLAVAGLSRWLGDFGWVVYWRRKKRNTAKNWSN